MLRKITVMMTCLVSLSVSAQSLLPDLVTAKYPLNSRSIDTTSLPGRKLLRLSNGVANIGRGRLELRGGPVSGNTQKVYQRIYNRQGGYYGRFAGSFEYHHEHGHVHFNDFSHYKLRKVIGTSGVGDIVADSDKVSFCLIDESIYNSRLSGFSYRPRYRSCGSSVQGISVGWIDVYDRSLAGQWIDITDVEPGRYWLESTADPKNRLRESNELNNTTRVLIRITD